MVQHPQWMLAADPLIPSTTSTKVMLLDEEYS
jgi:hypothetical protein